MNIFGKIITMLLILSVLISGCINKPESNTEKKQKENVGKIVEDAENLSKADWYISEYEGPSDEKNSEDARMSIIPHLRELGWNGGINVEKTDKSSNFSIVIALPFQLTIESIDNINRTLSNFGFVPKIVNKKIVEQ